MNLSWVAELRFKVEDSLGFELAVGSSATSSFIKFGLWSISFGIWHNSTSEIKTPISITSYCSQ